MSLVKCPNCGGEMSDKATTCPHCSSEVKHFKKVRVPLTINKKWIIVSLAIIVVEIILLSLFGKYSHSDANLIQIALTAAVIVMSALLTIIGNGRKLCFWIFMALALIASVFTVLYTSEAVKEKQEHDYSIKKSQEMVKMVSGKSYYFYNQGELCLLKFSEEENDATYVSASLYGKFQYKTRIGNYLYNIYEYVDELKLSFTPNVLYYGHGCNPKFLGHIIGMSDVKADLTVSDDLKDVAELCIYGEPLLGSNIAGNFDLYGAEQPQSHYHSFDTEAPAAEEAAEEECEEVVDTIAAE